MEKSHGVKQIKLFVILFWMLFIPSILCAKESSTTRAVNCLATTIEIAENENKFDYNCVDSTWRHSDKKIANAVIERTQNLLEITGQVLDENEEALIGVNILIKGKDLGTTTDFDGFFTLSNVSEKDTLLVSYIGYQTQEVPIMGRQYLLIVLLQDYEKLDEVVVVGYGTQKKMNVTGSVATVKTEDITIAPSTNVSAAIAGKLPGLVVTQNQGRPGYDASNFTVRGFGNNNISNSPQNERALVLVDGIQRSFNQIDPNEIESITILKDASAAVYGIQAAAGVILVTTKRGKLGKPVITLNSTYSLTQNTAIPEFANFQEHYNGLAYATPGTQQELITNLEGRITPERLEGLRKGTILGTDWVDVITRDYTPFHQHNMNISGGTENIKYFGSLGYTNQSTIWKSGDFGYQRYNATMNLDAKVNEYIDVKLDFSWRNELREKLSTDGQEDFGQFTYAEPGFPASLPNGSFPVANVVIANFNPIAITTKDISGFNAENLDILTGNLSVDLKIPYYTALVLFGRVGVYKVFDEGKILRKQFTPYYYNGVDYTPIKPTSPSSLYQSSRNRQQITSQLGLRYQEEIGDHDFGGLFLTEAFSLHQSIIAADRNNLISTDIPYLFAGDPLSQTNNGRDTEFGRLGYVGRLNYGFKDRYLLEISGRYDGSPYFPKETRFGFFSGVSTGWIISKESFFKSTDFVNHLKLRASYAQLGNDNANSFDYIEGYSIRSGNNAYVLNGQLVTAIQTLGIANPRITWQRSNTYNIGIESEAFEGKLGVEFDVFYRKRFDLLQIDNVTLPSTVGANVPLSNIESRDNRGMEFLIRYRNHFGQLQFNSSANISWTREKYLDYVESATFENEDQERIRRRSGQWVNRQFGYLFDGYFNSQKEIDQAEIDYSGGAGNANLRPGDIKLKDVNGDGVINTNDQVVIGRNNVPEIIYGWNTDLRWKDFSLTLFWQGAANFNVNIVGPGRDVEKNVPFKYVANNVWTPEKGDNAFFPARGSGVTNHNFIDRYYVDGTYLRLRNLVLGYALPKAIISKYGVETMNISLSGSNLLLFDKMGIIDIDPEVGSPVQYPIQRIFTFGVNISF